jgi:hypothetical protein
MGWLSIPKALQMRKIMKNPDQVGSNLPPSTGVD